MYSLFQDKQELFEAKIKIEGASLNESFCRLVVESEEWNLVFKGEIDKSGNCVIPIKKLRRVLPEGTVGTMKLEVIAEDTYFVPWESEFEVETAKSVQVEVKQQTNKNTKVVMETVKPKAEATVSQQVKKTTIKETKTNNHEVLKYFTKQLISEGITLKNARQNLGKINKLSNNLIFTHNITEATRKQLINKSLKVISKKTKS